MAALAAIGLGGCTKKVTQSLGGSLQVNIQNWEAVVPYGGPGTSQLFSVSVSDGAILPVTVTSSQNWLGVEQSAVETPLQVNLRTVLFHPSFPGDTLAVGHYEDTVIVSVPGSAGSPYRIPVELSVLPLLRLKPSHLYFLSALGSAPPPSQSLELLKSGGGNVSYTISSGAGWLQASSLTGALPDTLEVSIDISGLAPGMYTTALNVNTSGTFTTTASVTCTLVVASWLPQSTPLKQDIRGIDFVDALNGCAVGVIISIQGNPPAVVKEGFSLVTSDGGVTWNLAMPLLPAAVGAIDFNDGFTGWAVGGDGLVAKTTDGGLNWTPHDAGETADLFDVFFVSADTGWIVGDSGIILKTTDGGANWAGMAVRQTFKALSSVHFINGSVGWAVGDVGTILSSTDGGDTWTAQASPVIHDLKAVYMHSATKGWAVGKFGAILHYDGIGWTQQTSTILNELRDVYFVSDLEGWTVGFHGSVLHTTNGGTIWSQQAINVAPTSLFFCSKFLDALNGWIAGTEGLIFHTSNGGN